MKLRFAFIVIIIFMFGQGCSVYMAANQPDKKDVSVFNAGTPRTHVIAEAGAPRHRHTKENADGTLTDTFVFVQGYSSGSKAGRALFHGAADVLTLGLWEVIGTPVEAVADGTEVKVQVEYDANEKVQNIISLAGDEELKGVDSKGAGKQIQQAAKVMDVDESEEGQKLAAIQQDAPITRVGLRREPNFADNKDGTVTDRATGLMWEKNGSGFLSNRRAKKYIEQLNSQRFAGYYDWRMPTVEELASLLARKRKSGVHLNPVFDSKQRRCWTIDPCDPNYAYFVGAWLIDFQKGEVSQANWWKRRRGV
jgi:hypothetical protein